MDSLILEKYQALPDAMQQEVVDFIEFLDFKYHNLVINGSEEA